MAKDMYKLRYKIILALADSQMRGAAAARKLGMNHTTLLYHIRFIREVTGKDPTNFYDLHALTIRAKEVLGNG